MDATTPGKSNTDSAKLIVGDKETTFPISHGTIGPSVIDIAKLYHDTGMFTYDPGFTSTGSCESKITYIDGDEGILLYRGYPIDQLAENGDFLETCYLLLYGELPTAAQKADFDYRVTRHTMVHEQMSRFFQGFRRDAHPMAVMVGSVGALSAFYHDSTDISDPIQRMIASIRMIAKMPTLAAMAYKYTIGQPFVYPRNDLDYASNFLRMCYAVPAEEYKVNPVLARAMDRIFILHADHEQNASTSTVRLAGSSGANPFACIAAGIACLWGPAHGGANEAALKMLTVVVRKGYGAGYFVMNGLAYEADYIVAWPTAEIAVMGPDGAVNIIHRKTLEAVPEEERAAKRLELAEEIRANIDPYIAAGHAQLDDVIDPAETRAAIARGLKVSRAKRVDRPWRKHGVLPV